MNKPETSCDIALYLHPLTVNSIKVSLLCHALEITPRIHKIELFKGEHKDAAFLALNPDGKVPVMVVDGVVLTESNAILQFLANKFDSSFWPEHSQLQAETLKWLFWQSSNWSSIVGPFGQYRVVMEHYGYGREVTAEQVQKFHYTMKDMDQRLKGKSTLVGESLTIADISLGAFLMFAEQSEMPL